MPASCAYADGDPASDILAVQRAFIPSDASVPATEQAQLNALLHEAAKRGYPLRVAIVASPADLGSVTPLWRRPSAYAHFLGAELALVYHGTVLVVMPNGYGTDVTAAGVRMASGEAELPLPGDQLGNAALSATERLAASAGTPVTAPTVRGPSFTRSAAVLPWVVFAVGCLILAFAWWLSLRRRPIGMLRIGPRSRDAG